MLIYLTHVQVFEHEHKRRLQVIYDAHACVWTDWIHSETDTETINAGWAELF